MDTPGDHRHGAQRLEERRAEGAEWRRRVSLSAQAKWKVAPDRTDPVEILIGQGKTRIAELLPIRYARMKADPFAFLRGAAAIMAADLAPGPTTGLRVQTCGDCHLANFGAYATPEGTPVFDINDFDETLPAPFEWDVKRLAASLTVAGRVAGASDREARLLARTATKNYRRHLRQLALMPPIEAWSSRIDLVGAIADIESPKIRRDIEKRTAAVLRGAVEHYGLLERTNGDWKIRDKPPLVHHFSHHEAHAHQAFASYAETLQEDRRVLLQRYHRAQPRARARADPRQPDRRRLRRHTPLGINPRRPPRQAAQRSPRDASHPCVVGPADVAALAVHIMSNTAITGGTYDIDGGQQLTDRDGARSSRV